MLSRIATTIVGTLAFITGVACSQSAPQSPELTARWKAVGGDVNRLTSDPTFMAGVRSVAIGLGQFFDDMYPAGTAPQPAPPPPPTPR